MPLFSVGRAPSNAFFLWIDWILLSEWEKEVTSLNKLLLKYIVGQTLRGSTLGKGDNTHSDSLVIKWETAWTD